MFFTPLRTPPPPEIITPLLKIIKNHKNPLSPPYESITFSIKSIPPHPPSPPLKPIKPIKFYFYPLGFLWGGGGWVGSRAAIELLDIVGDLYFKNLLRCCLTFRGAGGGEVSGGGTHYM
jgi:hypothetical protein